MSADKFLGDESFIKPYLEKFNEKDLLSFLNKKV